MQFYTDSLGLTDSAFTLLRDLIKERLGLFYDDGKRDLLVDKLSPLVIERGFSSFLDYYYLLKYDETATREWDRVMDALAVPETYFWREMDQIHALVNELVPAYVAGHPAVPVRIWSAACASGEEPLSIAMALAEAGWFEKAPIKIYASDASSQAIARAREGLYGERSFRNLPPELQRRYFIQHPSGRWQINPDLHARISWQQANLMVEKDMAPLAKAPFIFCRNVFIYFSQESIRQTVDRFYHYMPLPGYLFVAAAESLLRITSNFKLQEIQGAFVYIKQNRPLKGPTKPTSPEQPGRERLAVDPAARP